MLQINGGSIVGTDHIKPGKPGFTNNHDAYNWKQASQNEVVAVVCDGCGSGKHSEVGSKLASKIIVEVVSKEVSLLSENQNLIDLNWQRIKQLVLAPLSTIASAMGGSLSETINNYFLFTIVGTIISDQQVLVFSFGDGMYMINEEIIELGPFESNAPPYLLYNLVGSSLIDKDSDLMDFQVSDIISRENFDSVIIGSDGVMDLIANEKSVIAGNINNTTGKINQFFDQKFFYNDDMINRRLRLLNREYVDLNSIRGGILPDDTTMIVIQNKPIQEE